MTNKPTLKDWIKQEVVGTRFEDFYMIDACTNSVLIEIISDYLEAHKEPEAKQEQNQTDKIIELQKKIIEKHDNERKKNKEVQEALQELKEAVEKDCWSVGEANIHFGVLKVKAQNLINALGVK